MLWRVGERWWIEACMLTDVSLGGPRPGESAQTVGLVFWDWLRAYKLNGQAVCQATGLRATKNLDGISSHGR